MVNKTTVVLVAALLVASGVAAPAHVRHAPRHARAYTDVAVPSSAPARMIEVRPGLWVGSYQCITDLERGGRDCSSSGG